MASLPPKESNLKIKKWEDKQSNRLFVLSMHGVNRHLIQILFSDMNRNLQDIFSKIQKHMNWLIAIQVHCTKLMSSYSDSTKETEHQQNSVAFLNGKKQLLRYIEHKIDQSRYLSNGVYEDEVFNKSSGKYKFF